MTEPTNQELSERLARLEGYLKVTDIEHTTDITQSEKRRKDIEFKKGLCLLYIGWFIGWLSAILAF